MQENLESKPDQVSIKKIAQLLGTTECTVSKALHNKPKVSETMRKKVWRLAERLGYQPNVLARSMARRAPVRIKLVCPQVWPSYYQGLLTGIENRRKELQDYRLETDIFYYGDMGDASGCVKAIHHSSEKNYDALILLSGTFEEEAREFLTEEIAGCQFPVFLLGGGLIPSSNVLSLIKQDSYKCGQIAGNLVELLASPGDSAAMIIGRYSLMDHQLKYNGFRDHLASAGIRLADVAESWDMEAGVYQATIDLFHSNPDISILYVGTENIQGALFYLQKFHLEQKIKIIATGTSDFVLHAMKKNLIQFTISENPILQGEMCMDAVFRTILLNQAIPPQILIEPVIRIKKNIG